VPKKVTGPTPIGPATEQTTTSDYNAKRRADNGTALTPEYTHLYYEYWACWDGCWTADPGHECYEVLACPVTRVTAKRIYFRGADNGPKYRRDREWFVSRRDIEGPGDVVGQLLSNGGVYHRGMRQILHLEPPPKRESLAFRRLVAATAANGGKSVAELRKEAADLHPDRGGDPDQFRAAHARYTAAKAATR
jgi:hypothetical protein